MINLILPHPFLSLALFVASLLMSGSVQPPSLVLAAVMAIAAPQVMRAMRQERVRLRAPLAALRLIGRVMVDVVRSNLAVARILLGHRREEWHSGFVQIPLALRDRHGLSLLAVIITCTPGTLWVEYERRGGTLLLHVLDLKDGDDWGQLIKTRYETLLLEIFP